MIKIQKCMIDLKSIGYLCDLTRFMVATQNGDAVLVADLERDEQRDGLDRVVTAVHVVAHEEVVCVRALAADTKQLHQVVELAVDVAAHCHRALDDLHVRLLFQNLSRLRGSERNETKRSRGVMDVRVSALRDVSETE